MTMNQQELDDKWNFEIIERFGRTLFLIYSDDDSKGSVALDNPEDVELWKRIFTVTLKMRSRVEI